MAELVVAGGERSTQAAAASPHGPKAVQAGNTPCTSHCGLTPARAVPAGDPGAPPLVLPAVLDVEAAEHLRDFIAQRINSGSKSVRNLQVG